MPVIALIDGPLPPDTFGLQAQEWLVDPPPTAADSPAAHHAAALAAAIRANAPDAGLLSLVVFAGRLACRARTIAQALDRIAWAEIALCAFGMRTPDADVARAVAELQGRGTLLVAAAPARGDPVYPAALPGVVSVQGDARCGPGDWSHLALPTAAFGACPSSVHPGMTGGSSLAAAHFAGHLAARLVRARDPGAVLSAMRREARHVGRERRGAAVGDPPTQRPDNLHPPARTQRSTKRPRA
jgi:hypothetical protein